MMPEMDGGMVAARVAFGRGVGTLPITATRTITEIAITELVTVTIATGTMEATDSDEFMYQEGFTSAHIGAGEM
jgi:hypothetical protein